MGLMGNPLLTLSFHAVRTCSVADDHGGGEPELLGVGGHPRRLDDERARGQAEAGAVRLQLRRPHCGGD